MATRALRADSIMADDLDVFGKGTILTVRLSSFAWRNKVRADIDVLSEVPLCVTAEYPFFPAQMPHGIAN